MLTVLAQLSSPDLSADLGPSLVKRSNFAGELARDSGVFNGAQKEGSAPGVSSLSSWGNQMPEGHQGNLHY